MEKTKLMLMTDSNTMTGFGNVSDGIAKGWVSAGYDVYYLGWGFHYQGPMPRNGYVLLPSGNDPFGSDALPMYLQQIKPEILMTQADTRMLGYMPDLMPRIPNKPTWIFYVVIDGNIWDVEGKNTVWPSNWSNTIKAADKVVAMTKYGQKILKANGIESEVIYHGVDTSVFKPVSEENRKQLKTNVGLGGDKFVFGAMFKNMQRKNPEKLLQAFRILLNSKTIPESEKEKLMLLIHTNPRPSGGGEFDLVQQATDYGLQPGKNVVFSTGGIPAEFLPNIFNSMDVFVSLGTMEGFCTIPETNIVTNEGIKPIKNIKEGEMVYTHNSRYKKVLKTFKRKYKGKLVGIKRFKNSETIWLTPNHPVLINNKGKLEWIQAGTLHTNQMVAFPIPEKHNSLKKINLTQFLPKEDYIFENGKIYSIGRNQFCTKFKHPSKEFNENIEITEDFMRFLGYYVAEGCASNGTIALCFNKTKDIKYAEDAKVVLEKFGLHCRISIKENVLRLSTESRLFGKILKAWFNSGARNKSLPKWIFEISDTMLQQFIVGFHRGDGSIFISNREEIGIDFTTTSKVLLHQIYIILLRLGISSSIKPKYNAIQINKIEDKNKMLNLLGLPEINKIGKGCEHYFSDKKYAWFNIAEINTKEYEGNVHNLHVEDDNSYTTESFTVHNCLPIIEAMSSGLPVIGVDSCTMPELIGECGLITRVPTYDKQGKHKISFGSYNGVECGMVDPWDVAEKMEKLFQDPKLRADLGFKATEKSLKEFDWRIINHKWNELVKSLVIDESKIPEEWAKLYSETKV